MRGVPNNFATGSEDYPDEHSHKVYEDILEWEAQQKKAGESNVAKEYIAFLDSAVSMLNDGKSKDWLILNSPASLDTFAAISVFIDENRDHKLIGEIHYKIGNVRSLLKKRFDTADTFKNFDKDVGNRIKRLQAKAINNSAAQDILDDFYANWAVVDDHGKTWVFHDDPKGNLSRQTVDQFRSYFMDIKILKDDGTKRTKVPVTEIWLGDPINGKRKYNKILMDPSKLFDPKSDTFNLWRDGFVNKAKQGDSRLTHQYVLTVICNGNEQQYNWLMAYYAHMIQRPWEKPGSAIALKGNKRIGKSFMAAG